MPVLSGMGRRPHLEERLAGRHQLRLPADSGAVPALQSRAGDGAAVPQDEADRVPGESAGNAARMGGTEGRAVEELRQAPILGKKCVRPLFAPFRRIRLIGDRKSTRLNSSYLGISYAV